jgi:hypothetical protein
MVPKPASLNTNGHFSFVRTLLPIPESEFAVSIFRHHYTHPRNRGQQRQIQSSLGIGFRADRLVAQLQLHRPTDSQYQPSTQPDSSEYQDIRETRRVRQARGREQGHLFALRLVGHVDC